MFNLAFGPLNKSLFTQELELVTKCILHNPDAVKLKIKENDNNKADILATFGNIELNLSSLFKKANFNHIQFDKTDSEKYLNHFSQNVYYYQEPYYNSEHYNLTKAEVHAIQGYTGAEYYSINNLLYGNAFAFSYYDQPILKTVVLETMMLASGLNKVPRACSLDMPSYRGEKTPYHEIQERIDIIDNGGGIIPTKAFNSTSLDPDVARAFSVSSIVEFDGAYGKNIMDFSSFPGEQELLLSPSQIYWESYEVVDGTYVFHAKVVEPLIEGKDEPTQNDISIFNKLLDYAKKAGVGTDFITPTLLHNISDDLPIKEHQIKQPFDKNKTVPITLEDCITDLKSVTISGLEILSIQQNQTQTAPSEPLISISQPIFQAPVIIQELHPVSVEALA